MSSISAERPIRSPSLWRLALRHPVNAGLELAREVGSSGLFDRAAQLAFWFLFALFPLLISLFVIFGHVVADQVQLRQHLLDYLDRMIPSAAVGALIDDIVEETLEHRGGGKLSFGVLLALWSGSAALFQVHREIDSALGSSSRIPFLRRLAALPMTLVVAVPLVAAVVLLFYGRLLGAALVGPLGRTEDFLDLWWLVRWPVILVSTVLSFDLAFNTALSLRRQRRTWITPGAMLALLLWLGVSSGLRRYLAAFPGFSTLYGSLGVVIVLMLWFYLTALAVLAGTRLNIILYLMGREAPGLNLPIREEAGRIGALSPQQPAEGHERSQEKSQEQQPEPRALDEGAAHEGQGR